MRSSVGLLSNGLCDKYKKMYGNSKQEKEAGKKKKL